MTALDKSLTREPLTSVKIPSRKRKKSSRSSSPNSNPFTSVFTRSRSRIFYHQNRSGFSRPDPVARKPVPAMESVESESFLDVNCVTASRVLLTKDLRHKRVFSPGVNSVTGEEIEEKNEERNRLLKGFNSSTVPDVDNVGDERIDGSLPKMKMAFSGCQRRKVFKAPSSFSYRRLLPHLMDIFNDTSKAASPSRLTKLNGVKSFPEADLSATDNELDRTAETIELLEVKGKGHKNDASVEENIQTTPPDPGIFAKTEVGCGRESVHAKMNQTFIGSPALAGSEKNSSNALKQSPNTTCSADLMNESVLNPCSRLRLFRNPRSVSYRRLLPFLMDISKTDSCTGIKPPKKLPQVVSEEDRHPPPAATAEHDIVNNTPKGKIYEKIYAGDIIQTASDGSSPDSNSSLVSSIQELSATSNSSNIDPRSVNSVTEETPPSQSGLAKLQLDLASKESNSVSEPSPAVSYIQNKQCTPGDPRLDENQNMCLSMGLQLHNGNTESAEIVNSKHQSFQINKLDALVSPNYRPSRGILKRNRRGCRGLCACLNCASFRLHAERSFEFSRNQLQDAEEVASQLMKELANVRLLLEKYVIQNDDSASIRPHPVVIKQACNKAIEAETLAKERLGELNNDLRVHCRIPDLLQPKVTFAHNNQ